jgi:TRAP-type C4-dicarboxylate transport system permease small subunit
MFILGALIALGAAVAFAAIGVLTLWGGWQAFRQELQRGFVSGNTPAGERTLSLILVGIPLIGAAVFGLLAAFRIAAVAVGAG